MARYGTGKHLLALGLNVYLSIGIDASARPSVYDIWVKYDWHAFQLSNILFKRQT